MSTKVQQSQFIKDLELPSVLLDSKYEHVPFYGRERELEELLAWCRSADRFALRFYKGPGGMGKTRLARELCKRLQAEPEQGWRVGFLDREAVHNPHADWPSLLASPAPSLIVVDYAESQRGVLGILLEQVRANYLRSAAPIRVVLLARSDAVWWPELRARSQFAVLPGQATALAPVQLNRADAFRHAAEAFAKTLGRDAVPSAPPALMEHNYFDRVLMIHMLALLTVQRRDYQAQEETDLLDGILSLEKVFWRRSMPALLSATAKEALARRCAELYLGADQHLEPLRPDILGEHLVEGTLLTEPVNASLREELIRLAFDTAEARPEVGLVVLIRLTQRRGDAAAPLLKDVLRPRLDQLAVEASFSMPEETVALRELAVEVTAHALGQTDTISDRVALLNNYSNDLRAVGRREEALAAIGEAVGIYQDLAKAQPDVFLPSLAMSLVNLAGRLYEVGRKEKALTVSEEAVKLCRDLSNGALSPYLAIALSNRGVVLNGLGFNREAVAAAREAVDIYQKLDAEYPDVFLPGLAGSLNNLSNSLEDLGRTESNPKYVEEAFATSEEASKHYRKLATEQPDVFLPSLADSLSNLGKLQSRLGCKEEALTATEEAVNVQRKLEAAHPVAFLPDLGMFLNNLSNRLAELGRREKALVTIEEVVNIYRDLTMAQPDAFGPLLAKALDNKSRRLHDLERVGEALVCSEEAISLLYPFFQQHPLAYVEQMIKTCGVYQAQCRAIGRLPNELLLTPVYAIIRALRENDAG